MPDLAATLSSIAAVFCLSACSSPEVLVTRDEAGEEWPFHGVDTAIIRCDRANSHVGHNVVLIEVEGTQYGLNGTAQGEGYPPAQDRMKPDEYGIILNTGPSDWIEKGIALCR